MNNLTYILQYPSGEQCRIQSSQTLEEVRATVANRGQIVGIAVNPFGNGQHVTGTLSPAKQCNDARLTTATE